MLKLRSPHLSFAVLLILSGLASRATAAEKGKFVSWAYTCNFGKQGKVIIDGTRQGTVVLRIGGKVYETNGFGGAYGFFVDDGPEVLRGYSDSGKIWFEFNSVRDNHCVLSTSVPR